MDHFDPALISVVMPCHNAAPYVGEAIASVLGQRYPQVELIVVGDGLTDGSTEIPRWRQVLDAVAVRRDFATAPS